MLIFSLVLLQILIFSSLVFFLRKILNRNVSSATAHLEQLTAEYTKKEDQVKKQLEEAKLKSQEIIANAKREAQEQRVSILTQAQEQRDKILSDAQGKAEEMVQQADRTRQALLAEINQKIEAKALEQAVELVQQALPEHIRKEIHQSWLEEVISGSLEQLDRLHIPKGVTEARVSSAFALSAKQSQDLNAKIKEKLGHKIELKQEVDPAVIAGLVVNIGSLVLDGSLRFKIQEVASAKQAGK
jgi:F0F1-type ATP synthase membrane subunit b/b'